MDVDCGGNPRKLDTLTLCMPKLDMHMPRDQILQPIHSSRELLAGMSEPLTVLNLLLLDQRLLLLDLRLMLLDLQQLLRELEWRLAVA
ncbi:hypothetical protein E3N88_05531 [Mikania micrantha]|uniref:Uncharacterized protein n=1 Tax=Mikania micrantha TaxID=192012 RepID=A0A5N6PN33_9ASTR|nr:hypothetical protein E3N88_05531 [Mikania micrantha]